MYPTIASMTIDNLEMPGFYNVFYTLSFMRSTGHLKLCDNVGKKPVLSWDCHATFASQPNSNIVRSRLRAGPWLQVHN